MIWEYLLSRNQDDVIVAWIHKSFSPKEDLGSVNKVYEWPVSHLPKLTADFVNKIKMCTSRTRERILAAFAR